MSLVFIFFPFISKFFFFWVCVNNLKVTMRDEDLNPRCLCRRLLAFHKLVNVINVGFIPYKLLIFYFILFYLFIYFLRF